MKKDKELEELEQKVKELRNKKAREWREKNKEKVKQINHNYWLRKAKQALEEEKKNDK